MGHQTQAKELLKKERMAKDTIVRQDSQTGNWYATCYIPTLGEIRQWGNTEATALANLRDYVTMVLKCEWKEDTL